MSLRYHARIGVGQGGSRHLAEGLAAQSMSNLAELRTFDVRELQAPFQHNFPLSLADPQSAPWIVPQNLADDTR